MPLVQGWHYSEVIRERMVTLGNGTDSGAVAIVDGGGS